MDYFTIVEQIKSQIAKIKMGVSEKKLHFKFMHWILVKSKANG